MPSPMQRRRFLGALGLAGSAGALQWPASGFTPVPVRAAEGPDRAGPGSVVLSAVSSVMSMDPALSVDTETERVCRQVFETLVGIDGETGATAPLLATDWEVSRDGLTYTFTLREDVVFHDGSDLTAEVVVANFQRWGRMNELLGSGAPARTTLAFESVFGGFFDDDECLLESVEAAAEFTVELVLSEPLVFLPQALAMPAFGIASAEVLSADDPELLSRRPRGTGAYRMLSLSADEAVLVAFQDYWDGKPPAERVAVRTLPRSFDRLRELQRGEIDVYDYITADNLRSLVQSGRLILQRDPFSVLYLGFNLDHPVMGDLDVREAAARAISLTSLVESYFLEGSRPAYQFTPAALGVDSEQATRYSYNVEEARELLAETGYDGEPLRFYYPMNATRSYFPRPEAVFASIARDLTAVGFNITPRPVSWDDGYVDALLDDEDRAMHLLGRNGGYRSPHSFFGPLFSHRTPEFNYDSAQVRGLIRDARSEEEEQSRNDIYREIADLVAEDLPALPLVHPISGVALGRGVADYPISPVLHELFKDITPTD
ncbi:ABC transporter substrate-binding protein [Nesterenkonia sp. E16_7]|uniref:ABC transporter substrate-binding protein n=1 Tax=unclassified Nesterenkonia TaxID=2629769 RepID=UPI001A91858E|nr:MULTISPECIES: ABC transporter substrate-binding protein [unclassified Nesterenkonia]MBO0596158.1 ABC transporter substrate-binding protein [Nesterenkonia sp. E16_10]MBO0599238.1 ABC transporter substrate-binding protein [Nesterenkonia sp. E16_7]